MKTHRFRPLFITILTLSLIGAGCRAVIDQNPVQKQTPSIAIPSDFPPDIPMYQGARVLIAKGSGDVATLSQEVDVKPTEVVTWIAQQFERQGATLESRLDRDNTIEFVFSKVGIQFVVRIVSRNDGMASTVTIEKSIRGEEVPESLSRISTHFS